MASYIGTLKSQTGSKSGVLKTPCDGCKEATGNSYCPECQQLYCKICAKAHRNIPSTKEHDLMFWDDSSTLVDVLKKAHAKILEKDKIIKELEEEKASNREAFDEIKVEAAMEVKALRSAEAKMATHENAWISMSTVDRPNKIAEDYEGLFICIAWLDAKEALDNFKIADEKRNLLLTGILEISYGVCKKTVKAAKAIVIEVLQQPGTTFSTWDEYNIKTKRYDRPAVSHTLANVTSYSMSRTVHEVKLDTICQEVKKSVQANSTISKKEQVFKTDELKKYIEASVRICWRMVLQCPAMTFSMEGLNQKFNGETQDLQWGSTYPSVEGVLVRYYAYPILMQGGRVLVKGKVLLR